MSMSGHTVNRISKYNICVLHLDSQGLNSLVNLEELNLADNAIETLGRSTVQPQFQKSWDIL